ncbi:DUF1365 domain-containing protein [Paracidovorax avenae]|uniref:DUF1365 domain-containing protein n=1 Tax=Paracidovorax avenae TaxID=80867 RepID=UPI000D1586F3|nr:DUF1365 domain-containing protein [Paracidovorax avenae]AVS82143.1 DUF1365 domain-containing protein [Paracidovorax avenae]AVT17320.1 DUF1365 domain-containing protein [Paracidovorax avenae]
MIPATAPVPGSALCLGEVTHQRHRPARHRLRYRVHALWLDVDELPELARRLRFFSLNRFNLFSLHERDYGTGTGERLRSHVERQLAAAGILAGIGPIRMLTMPRILGYAFNPLTVYSCHRPDGGLLAVLYEVNNTFGERHSYLVAVPGAQAHDARQRHGCDKSFHVSPFLPLSLRYAFDLRRPQVPGDRLSLGVTAGDAAGPVLHAAWRLHLRPLTDGALARAFFTHPLLTLKVMGAIHWEALQIWLKGVKVHAKPPTPERHLTIIRPEET